MHTRSADRSGSWGITCITTRQKGSIPECGLYSLYHCPVVHPQAPEIAEPRGVPTRTRHAAGASGLTLTPDENAARLASSFFRQYGGWSQVPPRLRLATHIRY
jgi:hypothetical protein